MYPQENWKRIITAYRTSRGLKQTALAGILGVNQSTISRWERGIEAPTVAMQRRLRDLLFNGDGHSLATRNLLHSPISIAEIQDADARILHASPASIDIHGSDEIASHCYLDGSEENYQLYRTPEAMAFFRREVAYASVTLKTRAANGRTIHAVTEATPFVSDSGQVNAFVLWREISHEQYRQRGGFRIEIRMMDDLIDEIEPVEGS
jgi:transcriptional regulator with XRE-family HTH domain